jgi:hypothetical protein
MPKTDDDVLRELLHRATDNVHAPSAVAARIVARHHRRLRNTRILSITTTSVAAAAVVSAMVVTRVGPSAAGHAQLPAALPATKLPPVKLTAVQVLDQLSVAAGRAPQPTGRYIALSEVDIDQGSERTTVFDGLTGDIWTYQHVNGAASKLPVSVHWSPTRAEFAAWPTNPARLRALLLSPEGQATPKGLATPESEEGAGVPYGTPPDEVVFQEATNWLWNPLLSPALRSAMYKVLAATPGVMVKTGTTDRTGRPAIEISQFDGGDRVATFESPSTGAVLEQDFGIAGPAVYTAVTGYASPPANPYNGG